MSAPRRRKAYRDHLSPAQLAWLTGKGQDKLSEIGRYQLWLLEHGLASTWKGTPSTPAELLARFGAIVPPERLREIERP